MCAFLQWDRYCVENFILDADAIYDVLLDEDVKSTNRPSRRGDVRARIKNMQEQQIVERALSENYLAFSYESPGLRSKEIRHKGHVDAAKVLSARLTQVKEQLTNFSAADWEADLVSKAEKRAVELRGLWNVQGDELCDAKRILEELHSQYGIRMPLPQFKRRVVRAMANRHSPLLEELKTQVRRLLSEALGLQPAGGTRRGSGDRLIH